MEKPNLIIYGRVIALSPIQEVPSSNAGNPAIKKRKLYLDCTRYDNLTGERDEHENKPLLEFGGDKMCEKLGALNLQKGDVVKVKFAIQGTPYKNTKTNKTDVFTAIRCYDCEVIRKADGSDVPQPQPEPAPAPQPAAPQNTSGKEEDLPF